jgi:TRAP-type C4-dicarboxylate transport system substrate-binding protein
MIYTVFYFDTFYEVDVDLEECLLEGVWQDGKDVWDELEEDDRHRLCEKALQEAKEQAEDAWAESRWEENYHGC